MKDMVGIKLEVGQYVFYFHQGPGGIVHEEAKVIKINPKTVRIEYSGNLILGKKKGQQSNIYNTTGRLFVLDMTLAKERLSFIKQIEELVEENNSLKTEVNKIHSRLDILDL